MEQEPQELNPGIKMLIDRIPDHPEEFRYGGRFSRYVSEALSGTALGLTELGMTPADAKALADAWTEYTLKTTAPKLTEEIITAIMAPPAEEDESKKYWGSAVRNGTLLGGQISGGYLVMGNPAQNAAQQNISYREHMAQQQAEHIALHTAIIGPTPKSKRLWTRLKKGLGL